MNDKFFIEEFRKKKKYRIIGMITLLFAVVPIGLWHNWIGYSLGIIIIIISFIIESQYKCPSCGHKFDSRIRPKKLIYCNNCKTKLNESKTSDEDWWSKDHYEL